ncbi:MAG: hypothetical protein AB1439_03180 [candidate division FCPU426 bacterium]
MNVLRLLFCVSMLFLLSAPPVRAGLHFGMTGAVKQKARALDQQVDAQRHPAPVVHNGTLLVQNGETLEIKDCTYIQKGDIVISGNAVLKLTDCTFIHAADRHFQYHLLLEDTAQLIATRSRLEANEFFLWWRLLDQSRSVFDQAAFQAKGIRLWMLDQAQATLTNSSQVSLYETGDQTATAPGTAFVRHELKRTVANVPTVVSPAWESTIIYLDYPVNTPCPEDAIEISADGSRLYFLFGTGLTSQMTPLEMLSRPNGTYVVQRLAAPDQFGRPAFYDLGQGAASGLSLDGECSFTPDGTKVYFHSNRPENLGYNHTPYVEDAQDIYVADLSNGVPGPGTNLGPTVNSIYLDGEHSLTPDGQYLYFASTRPGGLGGSDIYLSQTVSGVWSAPVSAGNTVNTASNDLQPCFSSDGNTMYLTTVRGGIPGIYSFDRSGSDWVNPQVVIQGVGVGEPSLTADGQYLYFVHVYIDDQDSVFEADVCCLRRK